MAFNQSCCVIVSILISFMFMVYFLFFLFFFIFKTNIIFFFIFKTNIKEQFNRWKDICNDHYNFFSKLLKLKSNQIHILLDLKHGNL
jgi:hypothetical protein